MVSFLLFFFGPYAISGTKLVYAATSSWLLRTSYGRVSDALPGACPAIFAFQIKFAFEVKYTQDTGGFRFATECSCLRFQGSANTSLSTDNHVYGSGFKYSPTGVWLEFPC